MKPDEHTADGRERDDTSAARASASMWAASDAITIEPGRIVGPYVIKQLLGEGGHGEVYLAEQTEPVTRLVAIKIIKPGMGSKAVIARFEQERQALAVMDHPNVARVLDAGTMLRGVPYFVMDYVDGDPITTYCDRHRLSNRARLELLIDVCDAVQHAHMKGIIHRDLKPSNILIAEGDSGPVVKVIDFGVAKALTEAARVGTAQTELGQLVGTREYMSPEQAEMDEAEIDTRTDVYSLGVVMYELLTGTLPFDSAALRAVGQAHLSRLLRERHPAKPSDRFNVARKGVNAADVVSIASNRDTTPHALFRELSRELDWIPLRAIRADPGERYRTASDLADDIRRYLRDEPLEAGPEEAVYRVRKFLGRHRGPAIAAALVLLALLVGLVGVSLALAQTAQQRALAEQREREAVVARDAEASQRQRAEHEAARARQAEADAGRLADELQLVVEFQASQLAAVDTAAMGERMRDGIIERLIASSDQFSELDDLQDIFADVNFTSIALRSLEVDILARALETIDQQFENQPLVQARLLQTVSQTMVGLGLIEAARSPQQRAVSIRRELLGDQHYETLSAINHMGRVYRAEGNLDVAESMFREAWSGQRVALGDEHVETMTSLSNLGLLLLSQGRVADAEPYLREVLDRRRRVLGDDHAATLASMNNFGGLLMRVGDHEQAERYLRLALEGRERTLGELHPGTLTTMNNLALTLHSLGKLDESEAYFKNSLQARRRVFGDDHPYVLQSHNNVALVLRAQGHFAEALEHYQLAVAGRREVLGDEHRATLTSIINKSMVLRDLDRLDESAALAREAVDAARRVLPDNHWQKAAYLNQYARTLTRLGQYEEAEQRALEAIDLFERTLGPTHHRTNRAMAGLAELYELWHEADPHAGHADSASEWRERLSQE